MRNMSQRLHSLAVLLFFLIVTESLGQLNPGKGSLGDTETNKFRSKLNFRSGLGQT